MLSVAQAAPRSRSNQEIVERLSVIGCVSVTVEEPSGSNQEIVESQNGLHPLYLVTVDSRSNQEIVERPRPCTLGGALGSLGSNQEIVDREHHELTTLNS